MDVALGAVGDFEAVEEEAEGRDLVEEDLGGDTEGWVRDDVIEDEGVGSVVSSGSAGPNCLGTVGRKLRADGDVAGVVVVDAARDDEIAREEVDGSFVAISIVAFAVVFGISRDGGEKEGEG